MAQVQPNTIFLNVIFWRLWRRLHCVLCLPVCILSLFPLMCCWMCVRREKRRPAGESHPSSPFPERVYSLFSGSTLLAPPCLSVSPPELLLVVSAVSSEWRPACRLFVILLLPSSSCCSTSLSPLHQTITSSSLFSLAMAWLFLWESAQSATWNLNNKVKNKSVSRRRRKKVNNGRRSRWQ